MSPRNKKERFCSCPLRGKAFKPTGIPMTEIEKMGISRGTVQRILSIARRKTAMAIAECKAIILEETICK
jgi:predicted DNA-binding protein (UPF0251 family)